MGNVRGVTEMLAKLRLVRERAPQAIANALAAEEAIDKVECQRICPVWEGKVGPGYPIPWLLHDSIHVEGPFIEPGRIHAAIVAGGLAGAYAIPQHEELGWHHTRPGAQAKYIEAVVMRSRSTMLGRLGRRLQFTEWAG